MDSCQSHQVWNRHWHRDTRMLNPSIQVFACCPGEFPACLPSWSPWSQRQDWPAWCGQSNTPGLLSCSSCGDDTQGCPSGTPRQLLSQDLCTLLFLSPPLDTPFHCPCTSLSPPQSPLNKAIPECFLLIVPVLLHLHPNSIFWYYCLGHLGLR